MKVFILLGVLCCLGSTKSFGDPVRAGLEHLVWKYSQEERFHFTTLVGRDNRPMTFDELTTSLPEGVNVPETRKPSLTFVGKSIDALMSSRGTWTIQQEHTPAVIGSRIFLSFDYRVNPRKTFELGKIAQSHVMGLGEKSAVPGPVDTLLTVHQIEFSPEVSLRVDEDWTEIKYVLDIGGLEPLADESAELKAKIRREEFISTLRQVSLLCLGALSI